MTVGPRPPPRPHGRRQAHRPWTPSPLLTWRDLQHLVVRASRPAQLQAAKVRRGQGGDRVAVHAERVTATPPAQ